MFKKEQEQHKRGQMLKASTLPEKANRSKTLKPYGSGEEEAAVSRRGRKATLDPLPRGYD